MYYDDSELDVVPKNTVINGNRQDTLRAGIALKEASEEMDSNLLGHLEIIHDIDQDMSQTKKEVMVIVLSI
eukprot:11383417-Ditylum_brightwellii.AAC.1